MLTRRITRVLAGCAAGAAVMAAAAIPARDAAAAGDAVATGRLAGLPDRQAGTAAGLNAVSIFPQVRLSGSRAAAPFGGYTPKQIRAAYYLNPLLRSGTDGKGQSIVIVDSFGSPTIRHDLAVFDRQFKLRAPASLMIIHPAGAVGKFRPTNNRLEWAAETTLDVEWAHVMAPAARIVLVETPVSENEGTSGFPQIVAAEKYVLAHHLGGVISQSFGATEQTFPMSKLPAGLHLRSAYIEAARRGYHVTVLSASGDAGATDLKTNMTSYYTHPVTSWPASDPLVTGVGGLDLALDRFGHRLRPDKVWNDGGPVAGGGGLSVMFARPAFQNRVESVVGDQRGVPDVSMSAACGSHSVDIYSSFFGPGWSDICGTSEATPLLAGIIALADQVAGHPLGPINAYLYEMAAAKDRGIVDITHGNNTVTFEQNGVNVTVQGWQAVPGYDLASGVGTVSARWFVPELVALARAHT
jgi:subtilase family serine protease